MPLTFQIFIHRWRFEIVVVWMNESLLFLIMIQMWYFFYLNVIQRFVNFSIYAIKVNKRQVLIITSIGDQSCYYLLGIFLQNRNISPTFLQRNMKEIIPQKRLLKICLRNTLSVKVAALFCWARILIMFTI